MTQLTIPSHERKLLEGLARSIPLNPFGGERIPQLAELIGVSSPPSEGALVDWLDQRISALRALGGNRINDFPLADQALVTMLYLYRQYHRAFPALDRLIADELQGKKYDVAPLAEIRDNLEKKGFTAAQADHYLALFYQFRRTFHFILDALVGEAPCINELRASLWNNIFTSDLLLYERHLCRRMRDFSTLLLGETGVGKGTAAAAIGRSGYIPYDRFTGRFVEPLQAAFVAVNLSQFPESLIESALFGHRKGAFTGAIANHYGVFGRCSAYGALFLDEIGELSVSIQIKLLQVLQERCYTPLGSQQAQQFSGRVIAAANRPLQELRAEGLRDDFYHRLCSDVIILPPLRQRLQEYPGEMALLADLTLQRLLGEQDRKLSAYVQEVLHRDVPEDYGWPGNVRELEQAVRRILLTGRYLNDNGSLHAEVATPITSENLLRLQEALQCGSLSASELLAQYCAHLYQQLGAYQDVARRTGLDWRTVKRYVQEAVNQTDK
ncbi:sigma 54-dependent transcriptional activator [Hahella chejuensis KCTC 2396]|uniref:Sigma 54-dependent transcriptional activator n=1 Tax=Hahella chejuensis (strain KCTC 2396) TaxID=349521 RepID=Q2SHH9_HAHCH|nr:sigma 54-interacting transcriptional regulator [Hahella chejuensis]ABC29895.1 sigma 54-dependent transcriptional activator [Hahella chejuensis KCTC 2396]